MLTDHLDHESDAMQADPPAAVPFDHGADAPRRLEADASRVATDIVDLVEDWWQELRTNAISRIDTVLHNELSAAVEALKTRLRGGAAT